MITLKEYDEIQVLLGRKGRPRMKTHVFAFTGLMRCGECASMITAEEKQQVICSCCKLKFSYLNREDCPKCETTILAMAHPKFLHYTYYRCTKKRKRNCSQPYIKSEELERQVADKLATIQVRPEFKDWLLQTLRQHYKGDRTKEESVSDSLVKAYKEIETRLANLLSLKLSPMNENGSLLSDEEYAQKKNSLLQEKHQMEEQLRDKEQSFEEWLRLCERAFDFAVYAPCWFEEGDWEAKRIILSSLGSNLTLMNKKVAINIAHPLLTAIEKTKNEIPEASPDFGALEPEKRVVIKRDFARLNHKIPYLLGSLNDVRTYWEKTDKPELWEVYAGPPVVNLRLAA